VSEAPDPLQRWEGVVLGNPHAKMRPRISAARPGQRPRTHQDPKDKIAEDRTKEALRAHEPPLFTGNVALIAAFYRNSRQVVDLDNLEKHLMDAANGILWTDDCQVTCKRTTLDLDRDNPRTHVIVVQDAVSSMRRGTDHLG
jgi:Holliday junction resolvase RusA-like endonuclease